MFGSTGMAGSMVTSYLKNRAYDVIEINRSDFNIHSTTSVLKIIETIKKEKVNFVINCIGLLVKDCQDNVTDAIQINSWFPQYLAKCLVSTDIRLIHLSTDCVFDGKVGYYRENSPHTEMNFYGRSKSLGEVCNSKDLTIRTSIIGPEKKEDGIGLFHWFVNRTENKVNGFTNAHWNGITTLELSKAIEYHINDPKVTGVYHLVPATSVTKYHLLEKINYIFDLKKTVVPIESEKSVNKILIDSRKTFDYIVRSYETQLSELKDYMPEYYRN